MPPEIAFVGLVGLLIVVVGVPAIRRGVFLPRELSFETPTDDTLTDRQRSCFQRVDAAVSAVGYAPLLNFRVTNLQGGNLAVSFLKAHSAIEGSVESGQNYFEWITKYEVGTILTTRNVNVSDVFDRMPHLLRHDPPADAYRATAKVAWREVANYLNPLADNFTAARFVLGLALGAGIPACRWALLGSAYTASGAAVGWLFTSKSFIWALVLGYLPLRLIDPGLQLVLALWMALVADRVAVWRMKRELLV
jgi:hypothetical protein